MKPLNNNNSMPRLAHFYVMEEMCETNGAEGRFLRHYDIESHGDSLAELIDNAVIVEHNSDGVPIETHGLYDYADSTIARGERILAKAFIEGGNR